ncbi:MAG: VacJ family lipoprotein, partial [Pseudohongiellaceae bacterium]
MFHYKTFTSVPRFRYLRYLSTGGISLPFILALVMFSLLLLSAPGQAAESGDPLEPVNRATLRFNRVVDTLLFKPLAKAYEIAVPSIAKHGVRNFFGNLDDVNVVVNDLLQGKFRQAGSDLGRVAINSTLGVGGLFNVAGNSFGLEKHNEDFGQTLARWGVGSGPYVVLPLLGPSTLRDSIGLVTDTLVDPVANVDHSATRDSLAGSRAIDFRARVLPFDDLIVGDEYLYIRGAYLQHREYLVEDG